MPIASSLQHVKLEITGIVQGVGFRPFLFRLASETGISGEVRNSCSGVDVLLVGQEKQIKRLIRRITCELPPAALIDNLLVKPIQTTSIYHRFSIGQSESSYINTDTPPDLAMCERCAEEVSNPSDRRYRFPFNSCADCGPRYTVITAMPYDRKHTSYTRFSMCDDCLEEYSNVNDRRFHTEGIACPKCGPQLEFLKPDILSSENHGDAAMSVCVEMLQRHKVIAIKGICGFHLGCDATTNSAVERLRKQKCRVAKPLAIMMKDLKQVRQYFALTRQESKQLTATSAPIVMLPKDRQLLPLSDLVAPGVSCIGVVLAYSPLHYLLIDALEKPLVMTSGNASGAPTCYTNTQALVALKGVADGFLLHDRDIVHSGDDSVIRIMGNKPRLIRRSRGFVPRPLSSVKLKQEDKSILAMGADMKNCLALNKGKQVVMSSHIGDLSHPDCLIKAQETVKELTEMLEVNPDVVVVDKHPDYFSTKLGVRIAKERRLPLIRVQHHHAHMVSCLIENEVTPKSPVLGIVLDGLGYGEDGTFWGGELLIGNFKQFQRVASIKPFPLFGFDLANRQPWRNLLVQLKQAGMSSAQICKSCHSILPASLCESAIDSMWRNRTMFPLTSSAGRLFDAVSALLGTHPEQRFEGEAAMNLEALAFKASSLEMSNAKALPLFEMTSVGGVLQLDPKRFWQCFLQKKASGESPSILARLFHYCFVDSWVRLVCEIRNKDANLNNIVALSGGVFQNKIILERMEIQLTQVGFEVFSHQQVPSNDGGIALGQLVIASNQMGKE